MIHWKLWADEKGDGFPDQRMLSNREKMNWAILADFLEDLKLTGLFAEDDKAFGAQDLVGEGIQEFLESPLFNECREGNFTGGKMMFGVVVPVLGVTVIVRMLIGVPVAAAGGMV